MVCPMCSSKRKSNHQNQKVYGGLAAVAWTDVIQVTLLVIGGLITSIIALEHVTPDGGIFNGLSHIYVTAGDKFHMIIKKENPEFMNLPGIAVLVGGLWVANLYYWGFNQYIIQRTLAAKSLKESQRGIIFAAFLKLIIPLIVVIPGIIAYVMFTQPEGTAIIDGANEAFLKADGSTNYDKAYPWLLGASTCLSALLCWMYVSKPVIVTADTRGAQAACEDW